MKQRALLGWLLLAPSLLLIGGLVVFPIGYNVWLSLYDKHAFMPVQTFVGLKHYVYFAHDPEFWSSVRYGAIYTGSTLCLQLVLGIGAALLLNEAFVGRGLLRGVVLFPYMIPTIVAVILWKWLLNDSYGLVNHLLVSSHLARAPLAWLGPDYIMWSLIFTSVWQFFPFVVVAYLARLQTIPPELYEAARLDGAGTLATFRHITLPMLAPALLAALVLRGIDALRIFSTTLVLTGVEGLPVISTYAYHLWTDAQQPRMAMAASVLLALLIVVTALVGLLAMRRTTLLRTV